MRTETVMELRHCARWLYFAAASMLVVCAAQAAQGWGALHVVATAGLLVAAGGAVATARTLRRIAIHDELREARGRRQTGAQILAEARRYTPGQGWVYMRTRKVIRGVTLRDDEPGE